MPDIPPPPYIPNYPNAKYQDFLRYLIKRANTPGGLKIPEKFKDLTIYIAYSTEQDKGPTVNSQEILELELDLTKIGIRAYCSDQTSSRGIGDEHAICIFGNMERALELYPDKTLSTVKAEALWPVLLTCDLLKLGIVVIGDLKVAAVVSPERVNEYVLTSGQPILGEFYSEDNNVVRTPLSKKELQDRVGRIMQTKLWCLNYRLNSEISNGRSVTILEIDAVSSLPLDELKKVCGELSSELVELGQPIKLDVISGVESRFDLSLAN